MSERKKTKLLIHSNSPLAPTGYGMQVALFAPLLKEFFDVGISAFYGIEGSPIVWEGIPVFPGLGGDFGNDTLPHHAAWFFDGDPHGGIVMTLCDVWVLDAKLGQQVNLCSWVPVDHDPVPPGVVDFLMGSGAVPIAMSRFGERQLGRLDPLYCPHGVDTRVYYPRNTRKAKFGLPDDCYLVGMVAANKGHPSRKAFSQALEAFAQFASERDDVFLYLHTVLDGHYGRGVDIKTLLEALGIPDTRVRVADQYRLMHAPYPAQTMATIYSALDVLLAPSFAEGFGVPVLEASACGVPSIVTNHSAMPEVQGGVGWQVGGQSYWTGLNSFQVTPFIDDIRKALEQAYGLSPAQRSELASRARRHAEGYDCRRVLREFMLPALRVVEQRFARREPVTIPSRLEQVAA